MGGGFEGAESTRRDLTESRNRVQISPPIDEGIQNFSLTHTHTTGVKKMEKKLGVLFTPMVTHINNTTTPLPLFISSNPNPNTRTTPFISLSLSLQHLPLRASPFSPTYYHSPSISTSILSFRAAVPLLLVGSSTSFPSEDTLAPGMACLL